MWASQAAQGDTTSLAELVATLLSADPALGARPDPTRHAAYAKAYRRFLDHLSAVRPLYAA